MPKVDELEVVMKQGNVNYYTCSPYISNLNKHFDISFFVTYRILMATKIPDYTSILFRVGQVVADVAGITIDRVMPTQDLSNPPLRIRPGLMPTFEEELEEEFQKTLPSFKLPPAALDDAQKVSNVADVIAHLLQLQWPAKQAKAAASK